MTTSVWASVCSLETVLFIQVWKIQEMLSNFKQFSTILFNGPENGKCPLTPRSALCWEVNQEEDSHQITVHHRRHSPSRSRSPSLPRSWDESGYVMGGHMLTSSVTMWPNYWLCMLHRFLSKLTRENTRDAAYKWAICPHLEYASSMWDRHQFNHIEELERVHNQAGCFVRNNYHWKASITGTTLKWPTLQERRCVTRQTLVSQGQNNRAAKYIPE